MTTEQAVLYLDGFSKMQKIESLINPQPGDLTTLSDAIDCLTKYYYEKESGK